MGEDVGVSEDTVVLAAVGSSKKKWIWISIVGVVLVLLIIGSYSLWINFRATSYIELNDDAIYMWSKCLEYCPTKDVYTEWGQGQTVDSLPGKGIVKMINEECLNKCLDDNYNLLEDKAVSMSEGIFHGPIIDIIAEKLKFSGYNLGINSRCRYDGNIGKDSCFRPSLERIDRLDESFIIPVYENITLNFTYLNCSEDGIYMTVELIEGEIIGMYFGLYEDGNSLYIKEMRNFNIGMNEIKIPSSKYSSTHNNLDRVHVSYITEASEYYPDGRISDTSSARLCE